MTTNTMLKLAFIFGAIVDCAIAISWFLIASGWQIPNILNGHTGTSQDYQLAMYVAAMFMLGWAVLLAWGALKPAERKELLLITAMFLLFSIIIELVFFSQLLGGALFVFGVTKRLILSMLFLSVYFKSLKTQAG